jgi:S1-C subfamily serine protease
MLRALLLATLSLVVSGPPFVQELSTLHIKVVLVDADGRTTPVGRHALLVSENPAKSLPRRIVTTAEGTVDLKLRPGSYIVESDRPVAFLGKRYGWTQLIDIAAGRDATLELTAGNADVEAGISAEANAAAAPASDPSFLLNQWRESVLALWTPLTRASGVVVDAKGLVVTNQRAIGPSTSVEVQLTAEIKVAARVLLADAERNVAVLWIDPKAIASLPPLPLGCGQAMKLPIEDGQEIFTIGAPMRGPKGMTSGIVTRIEPHAVVADLILTHGAAGGPAFTAAGIPVGITSAAADTGDGARAYPRVARVDDVCAVMASAVQKMSGAAAPDGTRLPVEPARAFPAAALEEAVQRRAGSLSPYQMSSSDFDIHFITPVTIYGAKYQSDQTSARQRGKSGARPQNVDSPFIRPLLEFENWSAYVADQPPVLLVRMTPKFVEGFWTTVGRAAARTQGVSIPAIKHVKSSFLRMRALCGDAEVTPIHPFLLEHKLTETDVIYEGLYVFDPAAFRPDCGTVKLTFYSEKEPSKGDTRAVDQKLVEQIWQDFASYRALNPM